MTDASFQGTWVKPEKEQVTLPAPVPFDAPVLIGDCATPLSGETVLSLLFRRLSNEKGDREIRDPR